MVQSSLDPEGVVTDMQIPGGCPLCEGPLEVRASSSGAWSYCAHCHWLSPTQLSVEGKSLRVLHPAGVA